MTTTSDMKSAAADLKDDAVEQAKKGAAKARAAATDATQTAADEARARADGAKGDVADEMSGVSSSLRKAADDMRDGSPQARTFGYLAESLAEASDSVRGKDLGEMVHDVSDLARRNPLMFLGGAALLGFAAARFAKATTPPASPAIRTGSDGEQRIYEPAGMQPAPAAPGGSAYTAPATPPRTTAPGGAAPRSTSVAKPTTGGGSA